VPLAIAINAQVPARDARRSSSPCCAPIPGRYFFGSAGIGSSGHISSSNFGWILRTCVHCGFCTATCPTYLLLGDELDSPRGRIYLIKDMLESGKPATGAEVASISTAASPACPA
jgi:ferredoxin